MEDALIAASSGHLCTGVPHGPRNSDLDQKKVQTNGKMVGGAVEEDSCEDTGGL